jgi:tetratricopeptide (TPR) repeat protein
MRKTLLLAVLVVVLGIFGCDKARSLYEEGDRLLTDGKYDQAMARFDEAVAAEPASEYASKAKLAKATALFAKGEKIEKEGKYAEAFEIYQKYIGLDPEKDGGRAARGRVVYKAESAISDLMKRPNTPEKIETMKKLSELITSYDDSTFKKEFWLAYYAAEKQNLPELKDHITKAKKVMPKLPAPPYSNIWGVMEIMAAAADNPEPAPVVETPKAKAKPAKKAKGKKR